ncbi:MAG: hypothetical protein LBE67_04155 [Kocuria palustris]|nr:hypothetical protein [Kocuria palustris]
MNTWSSLWIFDGLGRRAGLDARRRRDQVAAPSSPLGVRSAHRISAPG